MNFFESADWLNVSNNLGYGCLPIPCSRDTEISDLLRAWMALDKSDRKVAAEGIPEEQGRALLCYSERMASFAVRERSQEWITLGLLALGMDGWRGDWRENVLIVPLHFDAAQKIGAQPERLFEEAAVLLPETAATALRSFLKRSAGDKTIEAMGYQVGSDSGGFRYKRMW